MKKATIKGIVVSGLLAAMMLGCSTMAFASANDINAIGGGAASTTVATQVSTPVESTPAESEPNKTVDNAQAIGDLFGSTKMDEESVAIAKETATPVVKVLNTVIAIILAIIGTAMMLVTMLDLAYLAIPFIRKYLDGGRADALQDGNAAGGGMSSGYGGGMGGMGGYGGYGGGYGSRGGGNSAQPAASGISRLVSDEAIAAYMECKPQVQQSGGMNMMSAPAPAPKTKMVLTTYFKKRVIFLIMMGVCVAVFATTTFTDLGLKLGMLIVEKVSGV